MSIDIPPWQSREPVASDIHPFVRLHNEILDFQHFIEPINDEYKARRMVIDEISLIIHSLWECANIHVMGSGLTGIITPYRYVATLSLFLTLPRTYLLAYSVILI